MKIAYRTHQGVCYSGDFQEIFNWKKFEKYRNKIDLIFTSPPFPLNNKKKYGNKEGEKYLQWFKSLGPIFSELLSEKGSLVIEIGNAWEPGRPVQSTLHLECLLSLIKNENTDLRLIQEFVCYNPSRLPSPAQWVTVNRIRTVDSYTHVWWLAKSDFPKADNSKVLRPYSKSMKRLLKKKKYNSGVRHSGHDISENGFLKDHGGSIAHNFFELEPLDPNRKVRLPHNVLSLANTSSNDYFLRECRERGINPHPARMPKGLPDFFIEFLTDEEDIILDPFAGSNTSGYSAEKLKRRWLSFELEESYIEQSKIRFSDPELNESEHES